MSDTQKHTKSNVPNLRFPEFDNNWHSISLDELAPGIASGRSKASVGSYALIGSTGIIGTTSKAEYSGKLILVARVGANAGFINYFEGTYGITDNTLIVKTKDQDEDFCKYIYYYLNHENLNKLVFGSGQPLITGGMLKRVKVFLGGHKEISKISLFLSLIDERISIQNKVIEKYESLIKALRHLLFSTLESVKEVSFADVLYYEQPTKYIVSDTEYSDNKDLTPVLTANKAFILGYTEEVDGIYDKGPCIILDDFTLDSKIVDFPFKVKSSAIKILSAKTMVSLRYIYEYLKYLNLKTEEHKRHYIAEIEPMTIELPEEGVLQSIASLFDRIDQRRNGLNRGLQLLNSQKDYLIRALFI